MAASGGQDQVLRHVEEKVPEKQGLFSKVKDSLNLTKHLGFVSDLDSPANQAAFAAVRETEEREGVTEEVPQAPLSERIMQGINNISDTAFAIAESTAGGVAPKGSTEQAESVKEAVSGEPLGQSESPGDISGAGDREQELSNEPTSNFSEQQHKHSWAHTSDHREKGATAAEKDRHSFSKWALSAAHKLGDAVASKDLTDDPYSKTKTNKT